LAPHGNSLKFPSVDESTKGQRGGRLGNLGLSGKFSLPSLSQRIFGVASISLSQVTKSVGSKFLIHSPDCGFWDFITPQQTQWLLKTLNESITAAAFAGSCYGSNETTAPQCITYKRSQIPWTSNENVSCPFVAGTCRLEPIAAYQMDTSALDSHDHLGLNPKPSERVTFRKVATCAPVTTKPYVTVVNHSLNDGLELDVCMLFNMSQSRSRQIILYVLIQHSHH
jgi:hypothetical protein